MSSQIAAIAHLLERAEWYFPMQSVTRAEIVLEFVEQVQRGLAIEDAARVIAQQWELS